jgi:hypothetical protein
MNFKPISITTTDQLVYTNGVKMLVYGGSGVGKTVLCSTLPDTLIISAEAGLLSLAKKSIATTVVNSYEQLLDVYNWLAYSAEARYFQSAALDSVSEIAEKVLSAAMLTVGAKDPRKAYMDMADKLMIAIKAFRDLPGKHVLFTAKMEWEKDEATGINTFQPAMPGKKLGPQLPYLFDEVFRLGINKTPQGETYRFLQTQPDLQYNAKDRSGNLATIEQPNLTAVIQKITGRI